MKITDNAVVAFHYTMTDQDGEVVETSRDDEAATFLFGYRNMIEALEGSMLNKEVGDTYTITLPPEMAYGRLLSDNLMRVGLKNLQYEGKLEPGMMVPLRTKEGLRPVTVVKVGKFNADIDINHPLAGKTLTFDVEIVDVRASTEEERKHGHVHGPGGHEH
ncbi:FKBP-type peptidyl-prolyl cis-trans isomerase [Porticoccus sp.]